MLADMMSVSDVALGATRRVEEGNFKHVFVFSRLPDCHSVSSKETTHVFPLYRNVTSKTENTSPGLLLDNFTLSFRKYIDDLYEHHYSPEELFGYIYAILCAPTYRQRYAEFLRNEYPRVRFPGSSADLEILSTLGWALVQAHLLREWPSRGLAAYHGKGDHAIEKVRYSGEEQAVYINRTQSFRPVPSDVWAFQIGGYQVLDKYLKSRKGRVLSLDEINHVAVVADVLAFTIDTMAKIDEAYLAAFPE